MKKVVYCSFLLFLLGFMAESCEKKDHISKNTNSKIYDEIILTKEAPKKGEIACSIKDQNGNETATGTRCGTPTGGCGRNYTKCQAVTRGISGSLPEGMTFEEFVLIWNDDNTRYQLEDLGYYEEDIQ